MAALIGVGGCYRPSAPAGTYEVDVLEDEAVSLAPSPGAGGRAVTLPRAAVPPNAREGDVIVDGRVDRALTEQLREDVRTARERLHRVDVPSGTLDLDDDPAPIAVAQPAGVVAEAPATR